MRNIRKSIIAILTILVFVCSFGCVSASAESSITLLHKAQYCQSDAREMLSLINGFRASDSAWAWSEDNTQKVYYKGQPLMYDYSLEKVAMLRALEISLSFSHTRLNGKSCFSAYNELGVSSGGAGENIAAGYGSAQAAFVGWREDNKDFSGQGHRRNMLNQRFNAVGIGHVVRGGVDYWVQELAYRDTVDTNPTPAAMAPVQQSVSVDTSMVRNWQTEASVKEMTLVWGKSLQLPEAFLKVQLREGFYADGAPVQGCQYTWRSQNPEIARISSGKLVAVKSGRTVLSTELMGYTLSVPVTVMPQDIGPGNISLPGGALVYDGTEKKPEPKVVFNGKTLLKNLDYDVLYADNINAGKASVTVIGRGEYCGTLKTEFTIAPVQIQTVAATSNVSAYTYNHTQIKPSVQVSAFSQTLRQNVDYSISYGDNRMAGKGHIYVTGLGNYAGKLDKTFEIRPASMSNCVVKVTSCEYTGAGLKPQVDVRYSNYPTFFDLYEGDDYKLEYINNVEPGMGTVKIISTGGNIVGTISEQFEIHPANLKKNSIVGLTDQTYTGKGIQPTFSVRCNGNTLREGEDYRWWVEDNVSVGEASLVVIGLGKYQGTLVRTFRILPVQMKTCTVSQPKAQTYTGNPITPAITVTAGGRTLRQGQDYTVSYRNNTQVGKAEIVISGIGGNHTGTIYGQFEIKPVDMSSCTVSWPKAQTYTGTPITPAITVTAGGRTLRQGQDYTVSYRNNTQVGTAEIVISGIGSNYTGTAYSRFEIKPVNMSSCTVSQPKAQTHTGNPITPAITVTAGSRTLKQGRDYTVSYRNNMQVGTAEIVVSGIGSNYTGTTTRWFNIVYPSAAIPAASVYTLNVGDKVQLQTEMGLMAIGWSSSSSKIASVSGMGIVSPVKEGTVTITAKLMNGMRVQRKTRVVDPYKPTGVKLDKTGTVTLNIDKTLNLTPILTPSTARTEFTWMSSSKKIATVKNGVVTPVKEGTATITVKTANGKKATVKVKVVDPYKPTGVKLDKTGTVTLNIDKTLNLKPMLTPSTAKTEFTWTSSSKKIATVKNGVVTPVKEGTATITVKTANGKKATVKVKVVDPYKPTGVKLDKTGTVTLNIGKTLNLKPILTPSTAKTEFTWTSSSKKIATVKNGVVTPVKEGTATITVKTANGKKATAKVKVVDPYKATSVALNRTGTVTLKKGAVLKLKATLTPAASTTGYQWSTSSKSIAKVSADGTVTAVKKGTATITVKTDNGKKASVKIKVVD